MDRYSVRASALDRPPSKPQAIEFHVTDDKTKATAVIVFESEPRSYFGVLGGGGGRYVPLELLRGRDAVRAYSACRVFVESLNNPSKVRGVAKMMLCSLVAHLYSGNYDLPPGFQPLDATKDLIALQAAPPNAEQAMYSKVSYDLIKQYERLGFRITHIDMLDDRSFYTYRSVRGSDLAEYVDDEGLLTKPPPYPSVGMACTVAEMLDICVRREFIPGTSDPSAVATGAGDEA